MSDQFVAEIRMFPFAFAPTGWAFCDGQLLPIAQNISLYSLLSTVFGGNGDTTFALPNLQGAVPLQAGQGQGLTPRALGEAQGVASVTLMVTEMPPHGHAWYASEDAVPAAVPTEHFLGGHDIFYAPPGPTLGQMARQTLTPAGGGQPHNNLMPYVALNYCIALKGIFPERA